MGSRALLVALLAAAAVLPAPAARAQEDPFTLSFNLFRRGLEGWNRTGSEKAFAWSDADKALTLKGQSGKEPPRLVYGKGAWDRGSVLFRAKKGGKKIRLLLDPGKEGKPVVLEVPRDAVQASNWVDLALRFGGGRAALFGPGPDGAEKEFAGAEIPAAKFRVGLEAPSGTDAVLSEVRFERRVEEAPQFHEPDFEPLFDGTALHPWVPGRPESAAVFRAEKGVLVGEVRVEEFGWLVLASPRLRAYEIRLNALWSTNWLEMRAVEVPGEGGQVDKFATVQVNFTDHLEPEIVNEVVLRAAEGKVTAIVNGKTILDAPTKEFPPTPISIFVARGKRCLLRDIRLKDLDPGGSVRADTPPPPPVPEAGEKQADAPRWTAKGNFAGKDGAWTVDAAEPGTGLVLGGTPASYELRFRVGRGSVGLAVLPRAGQGITRASGIRLDDALFSKAEWTEVVLRVELLSARVQVGGADAGKLDLDHAAGPPGFRVDPGGSARLKDLVLEAK